MPYPKGSRGVTRLTVVLLIAVLALALLAVIPSLRDRAGDAGGLACSIALDNANDALASEFVASGGGEYGPERIRSAIGDYEDLCPSGGTIAIAYSERGLPVLVCEKHGR